MKCWSQHGLQDTIIGELKIKTEKSEADVLTFKKLLSIILKFVAAA